MALIDGKPGVIEYSEIDKDMRVAKDSNGQLIYNYSHICVNSFSRQFLQDVADKHQDKLRYTHLSISPRSPVPLCLFPTLLCVPPGTNITDRFHIAKKKIPYADESGKKTDATKENGWKLEMFIFDAFQCAKNMVALEINRDEEFSPLKNGPGAPKDSPETCLADVCRMYTKCIPVFLIVFFFFFYPLRHPSSPLPFFSSFPFPSSPPYSYPLFFFCLSFPLSF